MTGKQKAKAVEAVLAKVHYRVDARGPLDPRPTVCGIPNWAPPSPDRNWATAPTEDLCRVCNVRAIKDGSLRA